jgi:hypothetical protein
MSKTKSFILAFVAGILLTFLTRQLTFGFDLFQNVPGKDCIYPMGFPFVTSSHTNGSDLEFIGGLNCVNIIGTWVAFVSNVIFWSIIAYLILNKAFNKTK